MEPNDFRGCLAASSAAAAPPLPFPPATSSTETRSESSPRFTAAGPAPLPSADEAHENDAPRGRPATSFAAAVSGAALLPPQPRPRRHPPLPPAWTFPRRQVLARGAPADGDPRGRPAVSSVVAPPRLPSSLAALSEATSPWSSARTHLRRRGSPRPFRGLVSTGEPCSPSSPLVCGDAPQGRPRGFGRGGDDPCGHLVAASTAAGLTPRRRLRSLVRERDVSPGRPVASSAAAAPASPPRNGLVGVAVPQGHPRGRVRGGEDPRGRPVDSSAAAVPAPPLVVHRPRPVRAALSRETVPWTCLRRRPPCGLVRTDVPAPRVYSDSPWLPR